MSEDRYFKDKANEIENKIHELRMDQNKKHTFQDIEDIIYIGLKEVARDQRYACVDAIAQTGEFEDKGLSWIQGIIQNAQIQGKEE